MGALSRCAVPRGECGGRQSDSYAAQHVPRDGDPPLDTLPGVSDSQDTAMDMIERTAPVMLQRADTYESCSV